FEFFVGEAVEIAFLAVNPGEFEAQQGVEVALFVGSGELLHEVVLLLAQGGVAFEVGVQGLRELFVDGGDGAFAGFLGLGGLHARIGRGVGFAFSFTGRRRGIVKVGLVA